MVFPSLSHGAHAQTRRDMTPFHASQTADRRHHHISHMWRLMLPHWAGRKTLQQREEINSISPSPPVEGPKGVSAEHKCECDTVVPIVRDFRTWRCRPLPANNADLPTNRETLRTLTADVSGPMRSHSSGSGISRQVSIRPSIHLISSKSHLISSRRKSEGRACR